MVNLRSRPHKQLEIASSSNQRQTPVKDPPVYAHLPHRVTVKAVEAFEAVEVVDYIEQKSNQAKTQAILNETIGKHRIEYIYPAQESQFQVDCSSTGNFQLVNVQWQGAFKLEQDPLPNRYSIYLVSSGVLDQQIDSPPVSTLQQQVFCCSPQIATILSPGQGLASTSSSEGQALLISIDASLIDYALNKLLVSEVSLKGNRSPQQPIIFQNSIDLTCELGLSLQKLIQFLWAATAKVNLTDFSSLVFKNLEKAFSACLVEGLTSNYSEELLYLQEGSLACHVRKAQAFAKSHLHENIKLGEIASAAGVCPRLLQKAFSQECGYSPMQFVARSRLEQIRQDLERSTTNTKIIDVMMDYCVTEGGKFARDYHQLFGEKPSETLKRSSQVNQIDVQLWQEIDDVQSNQVIGGSLSGSMQPIFTPANLPLQHHLQLLPFYPFKLGFGRDN
jgi:AraC-like DNA-binding protein